MRDILFRGKRLDNGEWEESPCHLGTMCSGTVLHDFDPSTVGQYTGLTDKNGKKIFEGDVIKTFTEYYGIRRENKVVVQWCDDIENDSFGEPFTSGYRIHGGDWEVIGNIHDNPELLEED